MTRQTAIRKSAEMQFEGVCASNGWESLHYRCKDEADRALMDAEIMNFFNTRGHSIPNNNAWSNWTDPKGTLRCVAVTNSSEVLEGFLHKAGIHRRIARAEQGFEPNAR